MSSPTRTLRHVAGVAYWIAVFRILFWLTFGAVDVWIAYRWNTWWMILVICLALILPCLRIPVAFRDARDSRREFQNATAQLRREDQAEAARSSTSDPLVVEGDVVITSLFGASPVTHGNIKLVCSKYRVSVMNRQATVRYNDYDNRREAIRVTNNLSMHYGVPIM